MKTLGTIKELWRFPVKSMQGATVPECRVTSQGLVGDRCWAMRDEGLKVQLFRFVDVLPMLRTNETVVGHLNEYLNEVRSHLPAAVRAATFWRMTVLNC